MGTNLEPGHLIMTKSGNQYIYFYFPAKVGPNIFILGRFFLIYWALILGRFLGPDSLRKLGPYFQILSELVPTPRARGARSCSGPFARSGASAARRAASSLHILALHKH